jgi:hypothetical protein
VPHDDEEQPASTWVLKWYFLLVALALTVSTLFGVWIGLTHFRHRRIGLALLILGTAIPVTLVLV